MGLGNLIVALKWELETSAVLTLESGELFFLGAPCEYMEG